MYSKHRLAVISSIYLLCSDVLAGEGTLPSVTKELVEAVALPEDFSYTRDIQSPAVQQYYSILQALALNQAEGEWAAERDDTMRPDGELLVRCEESGVMGRFKALVGLNDDMQHAAPKVLLFVCCC